MNFAVPSHTVYIPVASWVSFMTVDHDIYLVSERYIQELVQVHTTYGPRALQPCCNVARRDDAKGLPASQPGACLHVFERVVARGQDACTLNAGRRRPSSSMQGEALSAHTVCQ